MNQIDAKRVSFAAVPERNFKFQNEIPKMLNTTALARVEEENMSSSNQSSQIDEVVK